MRAVPGTERLTFCWNPTLGDQDFPADEAWPGDEYVDFVGVDVYDETWNKDTYPWPATASAAEISARRRKVWDEWIMHSPRGLAFWTKFAQKHGKPLAIPEWGAEPPRGRPRRGDNPWFVEQMHAFVTDPANRVAFHCYFDVNVPGEDHRHQLSPGLDEKRPAGSDGVPKLGGGVPKAIRAEALRPSCVEAASVTRQEAARLRGSHEIR